MSGGRFCLCQYTSPTTSLSSGQTSLQSRGSAGRQEVIENKCNPRVTHLGFPSISSSVVVLSSEEESMNLQFTA